MARDRLAAMRQAQGQFATQQQQQAATQMANYTLNQAPGYYQRPTLRPASTRSSASTTYTMSSASSTAPSQRRIATSNNATYDELNGFQAFGSAPAPVGPQQIQQDFGNHQYNWQPAQPAQAHSRSASDAVPPSPPGYSGSIRSRVAAYEGYGNNDTRDSVYSTGSPQLLSVPQQPQSQQPNTATRARPGHVRRPSSLSSHSYTAEDLEATPAYVQEDAPPAVGIDEMERFFETIGSIQVATKQHNDNINAVQVLHSRALNTVPESPEYQRISVDLKQASEDTRQLSLKLRSQIKELERTNGRAPTPQDANVKRTQTASVKNRFVEAIQRYSQVEAASRAASKQRLGKTYKVINPQATDEEVKAIVEDPDAAEGMFRNAASQVLHTKRRGEAQATLSAVQARHADIKRIEQTMVDLAQLFQDMSMMVEEQDETIVHIEQKAAEAEKDMEIGHAHLVKAKVSAMSARSKRKWCCGVAVILVLALVGGIVGYLVVKNGGFNHGGGGSGNSSDTTDSSSSSAAAPAEPTSTGSATGQQVDGGQSGQLSQPDDSQGNGNDIVFTPLVQQSAADPTTVTQDVTPSGAAAQNSAGGQQAIALESASSEDPRAVERAVVNARVQVQSSLEAVVHKTVVAKHEASATVKTAAASVTRQSENAAVKARASIQSSLVQVVHKTKAAEKASAQSARATSTSASAKASGTTESLKPTDIMKSIAKEVHGTELAHRHTANVDKRDVVPVPSGPVSGAYASAALSSAKVPQSSALPLTDVEKVMSSIAVEVHGTDVAPRHTAAAVVKRRDDSWILPRAMNFEQRARAWPFVDAEAPADELDAGFEDGGFVL